MIRDFPLRLTAVAGTLKLLLSSPASAASDPFHPKVDIERSYTSNVRYAGATDDEDSDWSTRMRLTLPLHGTWAKGTWGTTYSPSFVRYDEFTVLDDNEHRFWMQMVATPDRTTELFLSAEYIRDQVQARPESQNPSDLFVASRTDRQMYGLTFRSVKDFGAEWKWTSSLDGAKYNYSAIPGFDADETGGVSEDRAEYGASVDVARIVSQSSTVGLEYDFRRFELDVSESKNNHLLGATFSRTMGRDYTMRGRLGVFYRTGETVSTSGTETSVSDSGLQGFFLLQRAFREHYLNLTASYLPSSGGALEGTSTDTALRVGLGGAPGRAWRWHAFSAFARRDSADPELDGLRSVSGGLFLEWSLGRWIELRLEGNALDQSGSGTAELNTDYYVAGVGLVWHPAGRDPGAGKARPGALR